MKGLNNKLDAQRAQNYANVSSPLFYYMQIYNSNSCICCALEICLKIWKLVLGVVVSNEVQLPYLGSCEMPSLYQIHSQCQRWNKNINLLVGYSHS